MTDTTPALFHGVPVRDWKPGTKITEPGIYRNIPMEDYHGDICDGVSVSSSFLRKIVGPKGCLLKAWDSFYLNPDREEQEDKKHFTWGRALHHLSAGEADFNKHFAVRPLEFKDWRTNAAKDWKARVEAEGRSVMTIDDIRALSRAAEQLRAHPNVANGILSGLIEHSLFVKVRIPLTGWPVVEDEQAAGYLDVWLKVRPDVLPLDSLMVSDLKSAADASPIGARRSITDNLYHVQMAMIDEVLFLLTKVKFEEFVLLFIESARPHCINHKPLNTFDMMAGHMMLRVALLKFARAFVSGVWPTYDDDEVPGGLLPFAADRIKKEIDHNELPEPHPLDLAPIEVAGLLAPPVEEAI